MNKTLTILLFLHIFNFSNSQVGIQFRVLPPFGEMGFIMKPGYGLAIEGGEFFTEGKFRVVWAANIQLFTPRLKSFRLSGTAFENGGVTVYPGTISYSNMLSLHGSVGVDFSPLEKGKWFPYIGVELVAGVDGYKYKSDVYQIESTEEMLIGPLIGGRGKLGLEYLISERTCVFGQYNLTTGFNAPSRTWMKFWGLGIGIKYNFK